MDIPKLVRRALELPDGPRIGRAEAEAIAAALEPVRMDAGTQLFARGDRSTHAYVLLDGMVDVHLPNGEPGGVVTRVRTAGCVLGEMSLITSAPRSATVIAGTALRLLKLDQHRYQTLSAQVPALPKALNHHANQRLLQDQLRVALDEHFPTRSPETDTLLESTVRWRHLERGDLLYEAGDPAQDICVVLCGELLLLDDQELPQRRLGRGQLAGVQALLTGAPYGATARASASTWVATWPLSVLQSLATKEPEQLLAIARLAIHRLTSPPDLHAAVPSVVTLVPACPASPLTELAQLLSAELGHNGATEIYERTTLERGTILVPDCAFEAGSHELLRFRIWLETRRAECAHVLLVADEADSPWTRQAIKEADYVLLVGEGRAPHGPSPAEATIPSVGGRRPWNPVVSLALLHPAETDHPRNTEAWLAPRDLDAWHHLRRGVRSDLTRLARWVRGEAVGLALSGGGARGLAHIGIIDALHERGVPVDLFAGASSGAIAAVLAAEQPCPEERRARMDAAIQRFGAPWRSLGLPLMGLLNPQRGHKALRHLFGDRRLEDLWIPVLVVTTNLSTCRRAAFARGPIHRILLASVSPPGVAPPVPIDGHLHCDGGCVENLPVSALLEERCGHLLASSVGLGLNTADEHFEKLPSSWALLRSRLLGSDEHSDVPTLPEVVIRAMGIASDVAARQARVQPQLLFEPPVDDFSVADFEPVAEVARVAYAYAASLLDERLGELSLPVEAP